MRNKAALSCCTVLLLLASAQIRAANDKEVGSAVEAARSWLALVDAGDFSASWQQSARLFRSAVTQQQWEQALNASRRPLGALISREVETTKYATSLPGAPDGEYVVIQFTTSFANKKAAVETVTPIKDPDGVWRVSGYYIK